MERIKFLIFVDFVFRECDIEQKLVSRHISLIPSVYRVSDCMFVDVLNPKIDRFIQLGKSQLSQCEVINNEKYYLQLFKEISLSGYDSLFIMCPSSKFTVYYERVCSAVRRFKRSKRFCEVNDIDITVVDTRQFGAGLLLSSLIVSDSAVNNRQSIKETKLLCKNMAVNSKTYVITRDKLARFSVGNLRGYQVCGMQFKNIDISNSIDEVKYDNFAEIICNELKTGKYRGYAVSVGCACDFSKNVIGRIKLLSKIEPMLVMDYSLVSYTVFGISALCVHLLP